MEWISGRQPARRAVAQLLSEAQFDAAALFLSAINAGEVYYSLRKQHSASLAESWRQTAGVLPITIEVPTAGEIWDAALLKGQYPVAYADAFAAALALKYRCPLVTGDPEFRSIPDLELDWIGPATT
jgi:ribonuclease VapC